MRLKHRSSAVSSSVAATCRAEAERLAWVSGTSFGRLVVPEVCNSSARSSATAPGGSPVVSAWVRPAAAGVGRRPPVGGGRRGEGRGGARGGPGRGGRGGAGGPPGGGDPPRHCAGRGRSARPGAGVARKC